MSANSSRAVFLSYASQDAEAARRICDTLRASGVEVWFDVEGGLEHGDEWDAKIRRQIKECVLFIPLISANTQSRHEGYFRIEWDLAAERARGIASGVAFILPVVIDDTREPDALVPDRFRMVQWTRLPAGVVTPEVKARYLKLWSHRIGAAKPSELEPGRPSPGERGERAALPVSSWVGRALRARLGWVAAVVALLIVAGVVGWRQFHGNSAERRSAPPTSEKATAPLSEARKLVLQARALIDDDWLAVRENFRLADELCERATRLDPTDGDAWATWARVSAQLIERNYDTSSLRRDGARSRAERAVQLAPDSVEARLAMALMLAQNGSATDAAQRLRDLLAQAPMDARVAQALATTLSPPGKPANAEATEIRLHHPSFAGRDPRPLLDEARTMHDTRRRLAECEALMARAATLSPCWEGYAWNLVYGIYVSGDLDASEKVAREIPPRLLQEDVFAKLVATLWIYKGDGEKARAALARVPRDFIEDRWFFEPTAELRGDAYALSGRAAAAAEQWKQALVAVEKRLIAEPADQRLQVLKAGLFAKLGRRDEARQTWQLASELGPVLYAATIEAVMHLANGDREDAILCLTRGLSPMSAGRSTSVNVVRFNPVFAPIRSDPRVAKILMDGEAMIAKLRQKPDATAEESVVAAKPPAGPAPKSVAVLAFANRSDDKANEYFSDGIAVELLMLLQKIPGLRVMAQASAFSFKGKGATVPEIGRALGVAHVVEGSVWKIGSTVKIAASLSRADTGEQEWSEIYTKELKDVFAVQSELARTIVGQLRGKLTGDAAAAAKAEIQAQVQAAAKGGTKNAEAHEAYLQGKFFASQTSLSNLAKAADYFRRATDLDPKFARAWAALARTISLRMQFADASLSEIAAVLAQSRQAVDRALDIEPNLVEALSARFENQVALEFDWRGARESLERALVLSPANPTLVALAARQARIRGELEKSTALAREAVALDPIDAELHWLVGKNLASLGRLAEAEAAFRKALELNAATLASHRHLAYALLRQGRYPEAVAEAQKETVEWSRQTPIALSGWAAKNHAQADAALAAMMKVSDTCSYQIAEVHAFRGDRDGAFDWLERAWVNRDAGIQETRADYFLTNLHADPRWPAFLKKIGLHDEQLK